MKTKMWILLLSIVFVICACISLWIFLPDENASSVQIWSDGELLYTLDLQEDRTVSISSRYGTNIVTVKGSKIAVTEADCPDGYCMERGYCSGGAQVVCLPNRLVIRFVGKQMLDGAVG